MYGTEHTFFCACSFTAQVASSVGVKQFVVPGSTVDDSRGALELAQQKPNVGAAAGGKQHGNTTQTGIH